MKFFAYTLTEYHRVVHLDTDVLVRELFLRAMIIYAVWDDIEVGECDGTSYDEIDIVECDGTMR